MIYGYWVYHHIIIYNNIINKYLNNQITTKLYNLKHLIKLTSSLINNKYNLVK